MQYALVTGGSKGIGKAIADELASRKFNILLVARSAMLLQAESERIAGQYGVKTDFLALDLSVVGSSDQVYDWCHQNKYAVSVLVNNAGYGLSGAFEKYTAVENLDLMRVNMEVPVLLCHRFLPMLRLESKSFILNIASSAAYQAVPGLSLYAASKSFLLSFSRGLRQELHNTNVSITCVCPGATDTDFPNRAQIGEKGMKAAAKVNMTPESVAKISVEALFDGKAEVITGAINKVGAFMVWLLPKGLVEKTAMKIYQ